MRAVWIIPSVSQKAKYSFKIFVVNWYKFVGFVSVFRIKKQDHRVGEDRESTLCTHSSIKKKELSTVQRPLHWNSRNALNIIGWTLNTRGRFSCHCSFLLNTYRKISHLLSVEIQRIWAWKVLKALLMPEKVEIYSWRKAM